MANEEKSESPKRRWIPAAEFPRAVDYGEEFITDRTADEEQYGFELAMIPHPKAIYGKPLGVPPPSHTNVLIARLGDGLIAIKTKYQLDGSVRYAIWNEITLKPVDDNGLNLDDLRKRYPRD